VARENCPSLLENSPAQIQACGSAPALLYFVNAKQRET
jgi:hypothetical protein